MFEPEFIDEERVPLINQYENNDDSVYEDSQVETSFTQEDEQQQQELDVEINALERGFNVKISPEERNRFRLSHGYLQVEKSPGEYANISKSNGEFLAESTMRTRLGASLARSLLGIETPSSSKSYSRVLLKDLDIEMDELPPQRLEEVIDEVMNAVGTNTDLDMREFEGIDKALTRIQGELANNAGKLTELDEHLKREQGKLAEIKTSPDLSSSRGEGQSENCRPKRGASCEVRALVSKSKRVGLTVLADTPNSRENSR